LNRPTGSTDWKDAEPNPENQGQYNCVVSSDISVTETITEMEIIDPTLTETEMMVILKTEIL